MTDAVRIGLASWIIQDGNYGDFKRGDDAAFAVEFYAPDLKACHPDTTRGPGMTWRRDCTYAITGRVSHVTPEWWTLNVGALEVYNESPLAGAKPGDLVSGEAYLGVDPFFYFERLGRERGAPPLIHDWWIEAIDLDVTPWREVSPRSFERDLDKVAWKPVAHTRAWKDDSGRAAYVLECAPMSETPRWTLSPAES
jgi:hypothetical protein